MAVIKTDPKDWQDGDWAVWRHDLYPYFLTGPIGLPSGWKERPVMDRNSVLVTTYGKRFRPALVVDAETGQQLKNLIDQLELMKRRVDAEVHTQLADARNMALKTLGVPVEMIERRD